MTKEEILAKLASGKMKTDEASKLLDELEKQNRGRLYCKVSQKGAVSVYGLQRMPVTLYWQQWERLLAGAPKDHFVLVFIKEHKSELHTKGDAPRETKAEAVAA
jgi:hypothetical protein